MRVINKRIPEYFLIVRNSEVKMTDDAEKKGSPDIQSSA